MLKGINCDSIIEASENMCNLYYSMTTLFIPDLYKKKKNCDIIILDIKLVDWLADGTILYSCIALVGGGIFSS